MSREWDLPVRLGWFMAKIAIKSLECIPQWDPKSVGACPCDICTVCIVCGGHWLMGPLGGQKAKTIRMPMAMATGEWIYEKAGPNTQTPCKSIIHGPQANSIKTSYNLCQLQVSGDKYAASTGPKPFALAISRSLFGPRELWSGNSQSFHFSKCSSINSWVSDCGALSPGLLPLAFGYSIKLDLFIGRWFIKLNKK